MATFFRGLSSLTRPAGRAGAWFAMVTLLAGVTPVVALAAQATTGAAIGCAHAVAYPHGPFRIAGDHRTVLNKDGTPFVSYGTTVPGLSQANFTTGDEASYLSKVVRDKDIPKINATARHWCSNTVRLQVSQHDVTQNSAPDNGSCTTKAGQDFLSKALDAEVRAAEAEKLAVVVNDQTESDPLSGREQDPTHGCLSHQEAQPCDQLAVGRGPWFCGHAGRHGPELPAKSSEVPDHRRSRADRLLHSPPVRRVRRGREFDHVVGRIRLSRGPHLSLRPGASSRWGMDQHRRGPAAGPQQALQPLLLAERAELGAEVPGLSAEDQGRHERLPARRRIHAQDRQAVD